MGDNIPLLSIPHVNAMTPLHDPPWGVPIEVGVNGVNAVLEDATKCVQVR